MTLVEKHARFIPFNLLESVPIEIPFFQIPINSVRLISSESNHLKSNLIHEASTWITLQDYFNTRIEYFS